MLTNIVNGGGGRDSSTGASPANTSDSPANTSDTSADVTETPGSNGESAGTVGTKSAKAVKIKKPLTVQMVCVVILASDIC
jgi:hypothetical protein